MKRGKNMPNFKDIYGQEQIVDHLENAIASGKISHAYIINGERSSCDFSGSYDFKWYDLPKNPVFTLLCL